MTRRIDKEKPQTVGLRDDEQRALNAAVDFAKGFEAELSNVGSDDRHLMILAFVQELARVISPEHIRDLKDHLDHELLRWEINDLIMTSQSDRGEKQKKSPPHETDQVEHHHKIKEQTLAALKVQQEQRARGA